MSIPKKLELALIISGSVSTGIAVAAFNNRNKPTSAGDIGWSVFWGCIGGAIGAELVPAYGIAFPIAATYLYFTKPPTPPTTPTFTLNVGDHVVNTLKVEDHAVSPLKVEDQGSLP